MHFFFQILCGENVEEYIELLTDFTMHKGIALQLEAFRCKYIGILFTVHICVIKILR